MSTFGVHFWPQKVDKLITLKVDKRIALWRLYVFPYLGLFGPFFENTRTLIEKQTGTSVDKLIIFWNFQCHFSDFCCFLVVVFLFSCFLCFWGSLLMFISLLLLFYLMLALHKQTRQTRRPRKQRKKEKWERKGRKETKKSTETQAKQKPRKKQRKQ